MRTVCGAEGIVDVEVAQLCQLLGEAVIIFFFARVKADVFQEAHIARLHPCDDLFWHRPYCIRAKGNWVFDEGLQVIGNRAQ